METTVVDKKSIATTYELIRPHVRRTPVIEVDAADFDLPAGPLVFKLELLQSTGSFKPAARWQVSCQAPCRRPEWSRPRAAITASPSRSPLFRAASTGRPRVSVSVLFCAAAILMQ